MEALSKFTHALGDYNFQIISFLLNGIGVLFIVLSIVVLIYDRYIQRENQLLINYPLIGRMHYFFYTQKYCDTNKAYMNVFEGIFLQNLCIK